MFQYAIKKYKRLFIYGSQPNSLSMNEINQEHITQSVIKRQNTNTK